MIIDIAFFVSCATSLVALGLLAWRIWEDNRRKRKENEVVDTIARDLTSTLEEQQLYYQENDRAPTSTVLDEGERERSAELT